jgi:mevalonate kinase
MSNTSSPSLVHSHGKLLLTGEYLVLDGALSFALPTALGQSLKLSTKPRLSNQWLYWKALESNGKPWIDIAINSIKELEHLASDTDAVEQKLASMLLWIDEASNFFSDDLEYHFESTLEFSREWGLGSSSTLAANLSKLTGVNAFQLTAYTLGGSAYDVAVGLSGEGLLYSLAKAGDPTSSLYQSVNWQPSFSDKLHFVYLNQKMRTDDAVLAYRKSYSPQEEDINRVSDISRSIIESKSLDHFESLLLELEDLMSRILKMPKVKTRLFSDFKGEIKSLGSWGGDFILATGDNQYVREYFKGKGFNTVLSFTEMIK